MALGSAFLDLAQVAGLLFVRSASPATPPSSPTSSRRRSATPSRPACAPATSRSTERSLQIGTTVNGRQIVAGAFGDRSRMQNR
jgi:hypothetical protein